MIPRATALLLLLISTAGYARQDWAVCGTHPERGREELALHRRLRESAKGALSAASIPRRPSVARDIGEIAVIEDIGGVVARRNPFTLDGLTLRFLPAGEGAPRYRYETSVGGYSIEEAQQGTSVSGLGDDDAREIALPFAFPFFGQTYRKLFLNSDGNLTFGASDTSTSERSLGRMTAGPPRIAGLFRDLDPSRSPGGVRVLQSAARLVISFSAVPEFSDFGTGPRQTFQMRLFPDGRVEFSYGGVTTETAVVGIAPGTLRGSSAVVAFREPAAREYDSAIAERFTNIEEIDTVFAAQKFYETHEDSYDYLAFFNNLGIRASPGAVAYEVSVRSFTDGIGDVAVDDGREYGSPRRLQAVLNLGPLSQYPRDPHGVVPARSLSRDTPVTILGHEAGHLFLAFASIRDPNDPSARPMLGRQSAHWNFTFNSEASLLEGNRIRDNGPAATPRFATVATVEGYSPLDQYLMGLRPPEEVPPTFLVLNPTTGPSNRQPQSGVSFDGVRRDIAVEEVVQAEGRRRPDHTVAQRHYRMAVILVTGAGEEPTAEQISQVESYRVEFEKFYRQATTDRGAMDTSIKRSLRLSTFPAAGLIEGGAAEARVEVAAPPRAPLTVLLNTQSGAVNAPASAVIAAGQRQARFQLRGARAGVDDLIAEAAGGAFEIARSRIQVSSAASLRLEVVSGDKQAATPNGTLPDPLLVRVTDQNKVPYAGLAVQAAVSEGGVRPSSAVSGEDGLLRFEWTLGAGPVHELRVQLAGEPRGVPLVLSAIGSPVLAAAGVLNAASFAPGLAAGSIGSLFGASLTGGVTASSAPPLPLQLGGIRVLINSRPAPLYFVSDRQINFVTPEDTPAGTAEVVVVQAAGETAPIRVPVAAVQPGIFFDAASGEGAVLIAGSGQRTGQRPAASAEVIEVYGTGLGPVRASQAGGLSETVARVEALIANQPAEVLFSGLAPGYPGLYQVNVRVPAGLAAGQQALRLRVLDSLSNEVRISLR